MNLVTELLNLEDSDVFISDISIQGTPKFFTLESKFYVHHCPSCDFKMHSKGIKRHILKHPLLQDNYELVLILKQQRRECTNSKCCYDISNTFKFVNKHRRTINSTDMLIIYAYRELIETSISLTAHFHASDTEVFNRYVKIDRLPLTDTILPCYLGIFEIFTR